ncbi:MAG: GIY-YIG nuclease family protein [Rhodothermales bacterium]|nr:GIY-YIG nuclease family protein [Rhodothermales bacterium]MBO6779950.1 GIY-YIG nuclease family protein [Rhodothermales bacterium]
MKRPYYVYVIRLNPAVLDRSGFRKRNPRYRAGRPCAYVGSSVRPPDERFDQHKQGYKANRYAREFGECLLPDVFSRYNPVPSRKDALELEEYLAQRLREEGWGVWQG